MHKKIMSFRATSFITVKQEENLNCESGQPKTGLAWDTYHQS